MKPTSPGPHDPTGISPAELAGLLDVLVLDPATSAAALEVACERAAHHHLAALYCLPDNVAAAAAYLRGSGVHVGSIAESRARSGNASAAVTATEALLEAGATEVATIVDAPWWRATGDAGLAEEIAALAALCREGDALLKVVLPTRELTEDEMLRACHIADQAGTHIVQGGSWFTSDRALLRELQLVRSALSDRVVLKNAAAVRTLDLLLVEHAMGVGRFNAHDVPALLAEATLRAQSDGWRIAPPGFDR